MNDLITRLTSRKFLLAVAAAGAAYDRGETIAAAVVVGLYVAAEAAIDHRRAS